MSLHIWFLSTVSGVAENSTQDNCENDYSHVWEMRKTYCKSTLANVVTIIFAQINVFVLFLI